MVGLYINLVPRDAGVSVAFGRGGGAQGGNQCGRNGGHRGQGGVARGAKQGTLLITTGTPLDMTSNIDQAYIQGRELNMMDIQKWFFQKYMEKIKQQQPKPVP